MDKKALARAFTAANASRNVSVHLEFKEALLADKSQAGAAYHFELLSQTTNDELFDTLARFFSWRGEAGSQYLLKRLQSEKDPLLLATGLQILGAMQCAEALPLVRKCLEHTHARVRERACLAIGWLGRPPDVATLGAMQLTDPVADIRKWSATQQMHIWLRHPKTRARIVRNLHAALATEQEAGVIEAIVYTAAEVLHRRFGQPRSAEAQRKATVALANALRKLP